MNAAHFHLMLNHVPVVGVLFGLAFLAWGIIRRNEPLTKAGLAVFIAVGLFTIPVFLSGEPGEKIARGLPGVSQAIIEQHEEAATAAFVMALVAGVVGIAGLWLYRTRPVSSWFAKSVVLLALVAAGLMAWTANLGGQVRHSEIRNQTTKVD